jgi:hypothetical protein
LLGAAQFVDGERVAPERQSLLSDGRNLGFARAARVRENYLPSGIETLVAVDALNVFTAKSAGEFVADSLEEVRHRSALSVALGSVRSGAIVGIFVTLDYKNIITLIIAGYGAILSTFVLVRTVRNERRLVKVECYCTMEVMPGGDFVPVDLHATIVNLGSRPVVVNDPQLEVLSSEFGKAWIVLKGEGPIFPVELQDGAIVELKKIKLCGVIDQLKMMRCSGKLSLRASCTNSQGKRYFGNFVEIDMDKRPLFDIG